MIGIVSARYSISIPGVSSVPMIGPQDLEISDLWLKQNTLHTPFAPAVPTLHCTFVKVFLMRCGNTVCTWKYVPHACSDPLTQVVYARCEIRLFQPLLRVLTYQDFVSCTIMYHLRKDHYGAGAIGSAQPVKCERTSIRL
jgi:hypothetical protein